jgi:hypothetical protein
MDAATGGAGDVGATTDNADLSSPLTNPWTPPSPPGAGGANAGTRTAGAGSAGSR